MPRISVAWLVYGIEKALKAVHNSVGVDEEVAGLPVVAAVERVEAPFAVYDLLAVAILPERGVVTVESHLGDGTSPNASRISQEEDSVVDLTVLA